MPTVYDVHLVESTRPRSDRPFDTPIRGHDLEFYDSGVWVTGEERRHFFPYGQVRAIESIEEPEGSGAEEPSTEGS